VINFFNYAYGLSPVPSYRAFPEEEPILFLAGTVEPYPGPPQEVEGLVQN
jgi:hypothetical protein